MNTTSRPVTFIIAALSVVFTGLSAAADTDADATHASASDVEFVHFPRSASSDAGSMVIHAPQIESWEKFETVTGVSAVEVTSATDNTPHLGSVRFKAKTQNDLDARVVTIYDTEVVSTSFANVSDEVYAGLDQVVRSLTRGKPLHVPLDVALRSVQGVVPIRASEGLKNDPPAIFVSQQPAILVNIDGDTAQAPIGELKLQFVVNTNWDLFFDSKKKTWYLLNGEQWLTTKDFEKGGWKKTTRLPKDLKKLPETGNWKAARDNVPAKKSGDPVPHVYVSHTPAELILIEGDTEYRDIADTGIQKVSNTESDLFLVDGAYYYLVSGRWFKAAALDGSWVGVRQPPEAFAQIPEDDEAAYVRASVAGTEEANVAILEAQIPRKATLSRDAGKDVSVLYAGDPNFVPIEGTGMQRAANADADVLLVNGDYYLCTNAVWYQGESPNGPWQVVDKIPAEIYDIPSSDPAYHTTYVTVHESSPSSVTFGFYGGYYGMYSYWGSPWYGTGYYYPPYFYYGYGYPVYYAHPYSYGASSWYNPRTGRYGRAGSVYGPYGGYGRGSVYNPRTGSYARGEAVWDHNEIAGRAIGYNPRTGTGVATHRYANEDGAWGESVITRGNDWVATQGEFSRNRADVDFQTSRGASGNVTRDRSGNVTTGTGTVTRGDKTIDTQTVRGGDTTVVDVTGSDGGSGQITRTRENGTISGSGNFEKDGQTLSTDTTVSRDGARADFETSRGTSGTVATRDGTNFAAVRSQNGDLYVGRDNSVYRKTTDGWSRYGNGQWENSNRDSFSRSSSSSNRRTTTRSRSQLDSAYRSRSSGYQNYNRSRTTSSRSQMQRPRSRPRRR